MDKDILILGGGPGGYTAAIRAAQLGANVCIIEKNKLGGTCLNRGCIPTKALYRNAEIINTFKNANEFGISIDGFDIDVSKIQKRKDNIVSTLVDGLYKLMKAYNIDVINGEGILKNRNTVEVVLDSGEQIEIIAKNIIIATGSKPIKPPIPGVDLEGVIYSNELLNFDEVPKELIIVGGGVVGMEFASIFNELGSQITVIEGAENILSNVDKDITKRLNSYLKKRGIKIHPSSRVTEIKKEENKLNVFVDTKKGEQILSCQQVLISTGREPLIEKLNLDRLGIKYDRKGIKTNSNFQTSIEGIYAIGDVNGISMLAHAAAHQGISVVEQIMGHETNINHSIVPSCIFVFPEIACVGLSEDELKEKGINYKISKFLFGGNGKALALGEHDGLVKVISDDEYNILGVHIIGPHASDLIHEGALAINNGLNVDNIKNTIHAHPTLSETFLEAVLGLKNEAIHAIPNKKRK